MLRKSANEINEEIDALLRQCRRLSEDACRELLALRQQQLVDAGWELRDAQRVSEGVEWILLKW